MIIKRKLQDIIEKKLFDGKAILLMGPRQVGKTTLLKELFGGREDVMWLNGDELDVQVLFEGVSATRLRAMFGRKKVIIIDEAQNLKFLTLEEIRGWVDEDIFTGKPGIGIVLIGNVEVYNKMLGKQEAIYCDGEFGI